MYKSRYTFALTYTNQKLIIIAKQGLSFIPLHWPRLSPDTFCGPSLHAVANFTHVLVALVLMLALHPIFLEQDHRSGPNIVLVLAFNI